MLHLMNRIYNLLWPSEDSDDENEENAQYDYAKLSLPQETYLEETITRIGTITSVNKNDGSGMVDDIYFRNSNIIGSGQIKVGDGVEVVARRSHADGGWVAKQVVLCDKSWENFANKSSQLRNNSIIGQITFVEKSGGMINGDVKFDSCQLLSEYATKKGDWVLADMVNGVTTNIKPLRTKTIEGKVTFLKNEKGCINNEIFFTLDICKDSICRGDIVCVKAIESEQGNYCWRAVCLTRNSTNNCRKFRVYPGDLPPASKNNVSLAVPLDFGKVTSGGEKYITAWVRNDSEYKHILKFCGFENPHQKNFFLDYPKINHPNFNSPRNVNGIPLILYPSMQLYVNIKCVTSSYGITNEILLFCFEKFVIGSNVTIEITDPGEEYLKPTSEYTNYSQCLKKVSVFKSDKPDWIIPGEKPTRISRGNNTSHHLPQYPISKNVLTFTSYNGSNMHIIPTLLKELSYNNYVEKFSDLLHLEEIQMNFDIATYDMTQVIMKPRGEYLSLEVPGLAECRPSLLIGDKVMISSPLQVNVQYEGYIHEVLGEKILLKFHQDIHKSFHGEEYNVKFSFNRSCLRRMHQAIHLVIPRLILFPERIIKKVPIIHPDSLSDLMDNMTSDKSFTNKESKAKWFNSKLNEHQKLMVLRVLQSCARPLPHILFGPPGTGKTVTLVESILQILHHLPHSRVLACSPSNSAADLIAERLHLSGFVKQIDMVRLNAFQRSEEAIPDSILRYCSNGDDLKIISRYRLIICTCSTAGTLSSLGLKTDHFTHIFVDEAGQATEPECMIPITLANDQNCTVVLSGDHLQLGPVLRSKIAKKYGLQVSYLERLMNRNLYLRDDQHFKDYGGYNPLVVTKLTDNYRSNFDILDIFSKIFYHGELRCCTKNDCSFISRCYFLPNKNFSILFHGIRGSDLREGNSPSWFNPAEVVQIGRYLKYLYNEKIALNSDDIGIVTPYHKQVEKIRQFLNSIGVKLPKVGSIEEFQGQERKVILLSTVRSNDSLMSFDEKFNLGFVCNPKRFNVAISRAQDLLIVLGNPHVLAKDPHWSVLLKACLKNRSYVGCDYPSFLFEDDEEYIKQFSEVSISEEGNKNCDSDLETNSENELVDSLENILNQPCCSPSNFSEINGFDHSHSDQEYSDNLSVPSLSESSHNLQVDDDVVIEKDFE